MQSLNSDYTETTPAVTLSVVIPVFNEESTIRSCLDNLERQTTLPYEIIVVDNNSTDMTASIASSYPFVKVITESRQGIAYAQAAGFSAAKGTHIARIDADSVLTRDWASQVMEYYRTNPRNSALVGSGYAVNLHSPGFHKWLMDATVVVARLCMGGYCLWGPCFVLPREAWKKIQNGLCVERPTTFDDVDTTLHIHKARVKVVWLKKLRVGVRVRYANSPKLFWRYSMRWPGTLKNHGDSRWPLVYILTAIGFIIDFPLIWIFQKGSSDQI